MLGRERVEDILHDVLGYDDVAVNPEVYERDLPFDEAVDVVRRLQALAGRRGVDVGRQVRQHARGAERRHVPQGARAVSVRTAPARAARRPGPAVARGVRRRRCRLSFSAGVDAHNVADCVAAGLVPVTTCTDLLRAGGYGRLSRYLVNLEERMRAAGAATIPEFILRSAGLGDAAPASSDADSTGRCAQHEDASREGADRPAVPRGTRTGGRRASSARSSGSGTACRCSKCMPACPNDAIFEIDVEPFVGEVPVIEVERRAGARRAGGSIGR